MTDRFMDIATVNRNCRDSVYRALRVQGVKKKPKKHLKMGEKNRKNSE